VHDALAGGLVEKAGSLEAAAFAASASPASTAAWTFLMEVFTSDLTALLRWCAFSLVSTRFF